MILSTSQSGRQGRIYMTKQRKVVEVLAKLDGLEFAYEGRCPFAENVTPKGYTKKIPHSRAPSFRYFRSHLERGKYFIPCTAHLRFYLVSGQEDLYGE